MSARRLPAMKWPIVASLVGAVGCVAVLVLSLVFGATLPVTAIPTLLSGAPALAIIIAGWAKPPTTATTGPSTDSARRRCG